MSTRGVVVGGVRLRRADLIHPSTASGRGQDLRSGCIGSAEANRHPLPAESRVASRVAFATGSNIVLQKLLLRRLRRRRRLRDRPAARRIRRVLLDEAGDHVALIALVLALDRDTSPRRQSFRTVSLTWAMSAVTILPSSLRNVIVVPSTFSTLPWTFCHDCSSTEGFAA
jgi:hypothetical protein